MHCFFLQSLYKLAYTQSVYHVYVDGAEVASARSDVRPTTFRIGEPPIPMLSHSPENTAQWIYLGWSSLKVDYISLLQPLKTLSHD